MVQVLCALYNPVFARNPKIMQKRSTRETSNQAKHARHGESAEAYQALLLIALTVCIYRVKVFSILLGGRGGLAYLGRTTLAAVGAEAIVARLHQGVQALLIDRVRHDESYSSTPARGNCAGGGGCSTSVRLTPSRNRANTACRLPPVPVAPAEDTSPTAKQDINR